MGTALMLGLSICTRRSSAKHDIMPDACTSYCHMSARRGSVCPRLFRRVKSIHEQSLQGRALAVAKFRSSGEMQPNRKNIPIVYQVRSLFFSAFLNVAFIELSSMSFNPADYALQDSPYSHSQENVFGCVELKEVFKFSLLPNHIPSYSVNRNIIRIPMFSCAYVTLCERLKMYSVTVSRFFS